MAGVTEKGVGGDRLELPSRMFAVGEEPIGIRVTSYGPSSGIRSIVNKLSDEERDVLRRSTFGKFISLADQPSYSGRFGRFLMSRQLKVSKKHEIWFLFAGKPVRFSLREFAIVTGLPCGKFQKKSKKTLKNDLSEKPYWPSLFGKLETVSVAAVKKMLKRKTVTDKDTRIKYACLAILASVLMPTTHHPKIVKEHAEQIKDLEAFFVYPWGRLAFDMLISSVKEKNEIILSQNTIAIKGFVHAIQLVMVEAVPALLEVVQDNSTSASESDEDGDKDEPNGKKVSLSPGHARDLHESCQDVIVDTIIPDDGETELDESQLDWSDEECDEKVDNLLGLIHEERDFTSDMFTGGVTKMDVNRMITEAKVKNIKGKAKKVAVNLGSGVLSRHTGVRAGLSESDVQQIADGVASRVTGVIDNLGREVYESFEKLEKRVNVMCETLERKVTDACDTMLELKNSLIMMENGISLDVANQVLRMKKDVIDGIISFLDKNGTVGDEGNQAGNVELSNANNLKQTQVHADLPALNLKQKKVNPFHHQAVDSIINGVLGDLGLIHTQIVQEVGNLGNGNGGNCSEVGEHTPADHDNRSKAGVGVNEGVPNETSNEDDGMNHCNVGDGDDMRCDNVEDDGEGLNGWRKSKRQRTVPASLLQNYQCDKTILQRLRAGHIIGGSEGNEDWEGKYVKLEAKLKQMQNLTIGGVTVSSKDFADVGCRLKVLQPKMVDLLLNYTRGLLIKRGDVTCKKIEVFDNKFVSNIVKNYSKFVKLPQKEAHQFSKSVVQYFIDAKGKTSDFERFYFPFNFDKTHWVGVCVDCVKSTIFILDCDFARRTDGVVTKEMSPISQMVPYLLKQLSRLQSKEPKPFYVERPRIVPQNGRHVESGITAVLLMHAHALGGIDVCRCITADTIGKEAHRLAVMMFEENYEGL